MSDSGLRALLASLLLPVAALLCPGIARLACAQEDTAPQVVASCDFEGPYSQGDQQIQEGCANNWQWGRKDMVLTADADSGRPGTAQRIHVRGIASGGVQFFFTRLALKAGMYYRVSYWMKADGLEGSVRCHVRKIGYPWTEYLVGPSVTPGAQWRQYSFSGKCSEDVTSDVGVCWDSGSLGTTWLDDLTLEQSDSPFPSDAPALQAPPESGNLLPRSSCEGRRDHMWSMLFFGAARGGRWEGVEADWEDPQMFRAEGGKVGGYCMAVPSAAHAGQGAAITTPFTLLSGKPYTVSAWMRADVEDYPGSIALLHYLGPRHHQGMAGAYPRLTTQWQRVSFVATPKPPVETPGEDQTAAPLEAVLQVAPSATIHGTVYVDGLQIEAGEVATDYRPAFPFELYADIGQDGGNLLQWGEPLSLRLLAAAADNSELRVLPVEVTINAHPDTVVWRQALSLRIGEETTLTPDLGRRGLFRVDLRAVDPTLAAPQQMVFASVPPPRETGTRGMFGTHIAIRPLLVSYIRRLGFTWTRLHDCSLLTKWSATEPRPGEYLWHDEVAQGVVRGGLHILGLPDHEPEWARVTTEGASPVDAEAYARYCEQVARHYAGTIDHWELWNEPYMGGFYSGGAASFGELMQAGYPALKRGNPRATVLGWCADISNPAWGAALSDAARACIDVFSFHNYINSVPGAGPSRSPASSLTTASSGPRK